MSAKSDLLALALDLQSKLDAAKASSDAVKSAVDALPEGNEDLQKKIEEQAALIVSMQADLDAKNALLIANQEKLEKAKADEKVLADDLA